MKTNNENARLANTAISAVVVELDSDASQARLIQDLLCNLRHLCDAEGLNFDTLSGWAYRDYGDDIRLQPTADADYADA